MVNQQLVDYIKKELNGGVSEDKIRLDLFKKKWSEPEVENSLKFVKGELEKEKKEKKKKEVELLRKEVEQLKKQVAERIQNTKKEQRKKHKNPILALFLSFLYAGLGQFYNGELLLGFIFLIGYTLCAGLSFYFASIYSEYYFSTPQKGILLLTYLSAVAIAIVSVIDAYKGAKAINKKLEGIFNG